MKISKISYVTREIRSRALGGVYPSLGSARHEMYGLVPLTLAPCVTLYYYRRRRLLKYRVQFLAAPHL